MRGSRLCGLLLVLVPCLWSTNVLAQWSTTITFKRSNKTSVRVLCNHSLKLVVAGIKDSAPAIFRLPDEDQYVWVKVFGKGKDLWKKKVEVKPFHETRIEIKYNKPRPKPKAPPRPVVVVVKPPPAPRAPRILFVSGAEIRRLRRRIKGASFSSRRWAVLKGWVRSLDGRAVLRSRQIARVVKVFTFKSGKIKAVRLLCRRIHDPENAHRIEKIMTFRSSKRIVRQVCGRR